MYLSLIPLKRGLEIQIWHLVGVQKWNIDLILHLRSTCNVNKHFILWPFVIRFSALLMKSSRIMRNSAPAALAIAQDTYKENHFRIIIEKYGANVKIQPK